MSKIDLTILIPAYNEEKSILDLLKSINRSNLAGIMTEAIVLINGSTDKTLNVVMNFIRTKKNSNILWTVSDIKKGGKTEALNVGLSLSKSEIIVNVDADCRLEKYSLVRVYDKLRINKGLLLVGGLDKPDFRHSDQNNLLYQYQRVSQIYREVRGRVLPVGRLMGYKRSNIGKFPKSLHSEDTWLALDIAKRYGWESIKVIPDAVVNFSPALNWPDYIKQESRFERGFQQLLDRFPELENIYNQRRANIKHKSKEQTELEVLEKMAEFKIPRERWTELSDIINPIIAENSLMMKYQLISIKGNWDPVESTKK